MNVELSKIITEALPLIERQVGDVFDKYSIEKDFRMHNPRPGTEFVDVMPQLIKSWSIPSEGIFLIECIYHDMHTRCHTFESIEELNEHILSSSSFLNWYISYVVPIIHGKVSEFDVYTKSGEKIIKHIFDETSTNETTANCQLEWRS
jgi:hypothetical protein